MNMNFSVPPPPMVHAPSPMASPSDPNPYYMSSGSGPSQQPHWRPNRNWQPANLSGNRPCGSQSGNRPNLPGNRPGGSGTGNRPGGPPIRPGGSGTNGNWRNHRPPNPRNMRGGNNYNRNFPTPNNYPGYNPFNGSPYFNPVLQWQQQQRLHTLEYNSDDSRPMSQMSDMSMRGDMDTQSQTSTNTDPNEPEIVMDEPTKKGKKRKSMSQSYPTKPWNKEAAERALAVEQEYAKSNKSQSLLIKFPDPEVNKDTVKALHSDIMNVHFQIPSGARFCFVTLAETANVDKVIEVLNQHQFGTGTLHAERRTGKEEENVSAEGIDPYTLYVGNLANNVAMPAVKSKYPTAARVDVGYAQRMKHTRYAFVRFNEPQEAIDAFKETHNLMIDNRNVIVRFRRVTPNNRKKQKTDVAAANNPIPTQSSSSNTKVENGEPPNKKRKPAQIEKPKVPINAQTIIGSFLPTRPRAPVTQNIDDEDDDDDDSDGFDFTDDEEDRKIANNQEQDRAVAPPEIEDEDETDEDEDTGNDDDTDDDDEDEEEEDDDDDYDELIAPPVPLGANSDDDPDDYDDDDSGDDDYE